MKKLLFASSSICIVITYLIGVIIWGEAHPFSRFAMYSSFADYSYAFYFTNENNQLIKCTDLNTTGTNLAHMYTTLCEKNNFSHGHGTESDSVLAVVGKQMLAIVKLNNVNPKHKNKKVQLHRIYFFYEGQIIKHKTHLMYEEEFK